MNEDEFKIIVSLEERMAKLEKSQIKVIENFNGILALVKKEFENLIQVMKILK